MSDVVNKPSHYRIYPNIEAIDIIRKTLTREQFIGYLIGNSLKYRLRAGYKNDANEDIAKARKYEEWLEETKVQECDSWGTATTGRSIPGTF